MRIFIGIVEIAGYYSNLAQGLRELGHDVTFLGGNYHPFQYSQEKLHLFPRLHNYVQTKRVRTPRLKIFQKIFWVFCEKFFNYALFLWALGRHDVFIFGYGASFDVRGWDLFWLRLFKKKIISNISHGSEARPPYIDGGSIDIDGRSVSVRELAKRSRLVAEKISFIEKYSHVVIGSPLTSHFLTRPFVNFFCMGIPWFFESAENSVVSARESLRILHAPSRMISKGTTEIRKAIRCLQEKGYSINYVEVQGKPHAEVLEEIRKCDFIIDQLYSDTPLAGFATEAAWHKKPAIVGGYGWSQLDAVLGAQDIPPSEVCHPDHLEASIIKLIDDPDYRIGLGMDAFHYVSSNWNRQRVTERFMDLINDRISPEWLCTPLEFSYLHGWGLPENLTRRNVQNLLQDFGIKSLRLSHRPDLEEKFRLFAAENTAS